MKTEKVSMPTVSSIVGERHVESSVVPDVVPQNDERPNMLADELRISSPEIGRIIGEEKAEVDRLAQEALSRKGPPAGQD